MDKLKDHQQQRWPWRAFVLHCMAASISSTESDVIELSHHWNICTRKNKSRCTAQDWKKTSLNKIQNKRHKLVLSQQTTTTQAAITGALHSCTNEYRKRLEGQRKNRNISKTRTHLRNTTSTRVDNRIIITCYQTPRAVLSASTPLSNQHRTAPHRITPPHFHYTPHYTETPAIRILATFTHLGFATIKRR